MKPGFCVLSGPTGAEIRVFAARSNLRDGLIAVSKAPSHAAILMGRLYYRHELEAAVSVLVDAVNQSDSSSNPAALALAVYRQMGWKALARLEGDYALVIWDGPAQTLIAARDPLGGYPLFWIRQGEQISLATSLQPLLEQLSQRTLSLEYLADFLTVIGPINERASEHCAFESVWRVEAGTLLRIHLVSGQEECWAYWDWRDQIEPPATDRLEELAGPYMQLLRAAVRERSIGVVAAHLSGGMDSTTVALMARDYLQARSDPAPVHAISLVYKQLAVLARETPYLEVAWQQPGLVLHQVAADGLLDFDSFRDPPPHDEPYVGLWRFAMDRATVEAAAEAGATTLLTGLGADELLDWHPFHLADLLTAGQLRTAWSVACAWARANHSNPWQVLEQFGITVALRSGLPALLRWLLPAHVPAPLANADPLHIAPWIRSTFARRYALRDRALQQARRRYQACRSTRLSFVLDSIASRVGDVARGTLATPRGLAIAHPFLDVRVVRFGLGVLDRIEPVPDRLKPLLAEATHGLLPEPIRTRSRKSHFNEVYYLGLARNLPYLEALLQTPVVQDLDWLDATVLLRHLRQGALGGAGVRPLHAMNLTLSLLCWLTHQEQWLASGSPPLEVFTMPYAGVSPTECPTRGMEYRHECYNND